MEDFYHLLFLQYIGYEQLLKSLIDSTTGDKIAKIKEQFTAWKLKKDKLTIPPLIKALGDKDSRIREMVIDAMGEIADKNDKEVLNTLGKISNEDIDKKIRKLAKKTKKKIEKGK